MPNYLWKGVNIQGHPLEGAVESNNTKQVLDDLRKKNIFKVKFHRIRTIGLRTTLGDEVLLHFLNHLHRLLESGLELVDCLSFIIQYQTNHLFSYILCSIRQNLQEGQSITDSFKQHESCFPPILIHLIQVAEKSGELQNIAGELLKFFSFQNKFAQERRKMLAYPITVSILAFVLFLGILVFIVPNFKSMFLALGEDLPALTKGIVWLSDSLINNPHYWILGGIGVGGGIVYLSKWIEWGWFLQFIPVVRKIEHSIRLLFYARSMMIMLQSGTKLRESLEVAESLFPKRLQPEIRRVHQQVDSGTLLVDAYGSCKLFPPLFVHLIALGESSGYLVPTFERISILYQERVEKRMAILHSLIEPLFTVMLAMGILAILLSIYLPIFSMADHF